MRRFLRRAGFVALPALFLGCSALLDFDRLEHGGDAGVGDLAGADLRGLDLAGVDLAGGCPSFPAGGPSFTADETNVTTGKLFSLGVGDLDEDGRPDFVLGTNEATTQVEVKLKGPSGRSFVSLSPVDGGCTGPNTYLVATPVGLFDDDAHLDVIAVCNDTTATDPAQLYLLHGDGKGGFTAAAAFSAPRRFSHAIAADVDGDGRADLVGIDKLGGGIAIYWGGSSLRTASPQLIPTGVDPTGVSVRAIAPGQLPSVAVAHIEDTAGDMATDPSHLTLLRQTSARVFEVAGREDFISDITGVVLGRFTDDDYLDALLISNTGPLRLKKGKADGTLENAVAAGTAPLHQQYPTAGDLDCDGIEDVVMSHFQTLSGPESAWDVVSARRGAANGLFATLTTPTFPDGPQPGETAVADFDGDGRRDIAIAVFDSAMSRVRILWSNPP